MDVGYPRSSTIRLVAADELTGGEIYIALSHCWGNSQPLRLTRTTASRLKVGFPSRELPKTFRDAIDVTRKMQVRYLWIDSLYVVSD